MITRTYGTTPHDVIRGRLPQHYSMSLNRGDMLYLLKALEALQHYGATAEAEWAVGMRTGILETIGIEEV